jgi:hypothetical protein
VNPLAKSRDYADISPAAGDIRGSREQDVDVQVAAAKARRLPSFYLRLGFLLP